GLITRKLRLNFTEDILGQLKLPGIECLSCAPEAGAVAVSAGLLLSFPGESCLLFRLAALLIGAGDLEGKLPVVIFKCTNPGGDAADQPACHRSDERQQRSDSRSALCPGAGALGARNGAAVN